jgi:hypothetical protein
MVCLIEGGEYLGLNVGAICTSKLNETFKVIGFVKEWYGLSSSNTVNDDLELRFYKITSSYKDKKDYILGLTYNKNDHSKDILSLFDPKNISLVQSLKKTSSHYLLNKERLNKFIKAMQIDIKPDKSDSIALTKRCVGMKILVKLIDNYSDKLNDLLDHDFKNKLIGILIQECTSSSDSEKALKCEWLDQKLYVLKKFATERDITLKSKSEAKVKVKFTRHMMSLSKPLKSSPKETYAMSVALKAAMNYGVVEGIIDYIVIPFEDLHSSKYHSDNVVIVDSSKCDSVEKLRYIFKYCDVIVSSDVDIKTMHAEFKGINKQLAYFKSIVLIDAINIKKLTEISRTDPDVKTGSNDEMKIGDTFISEISTFCNFEPKELKEILIGTEANNLEKRVCTLIKHLKNKDKKEEEKKEKNKGEQKEEEVDDNWFRPEEFNFDEDNDFTHAYGLNSDKKFSDIVAQLGAYDSGNYNLDNAESNDNEVDLYEKVYNCSTNDVETEYLGTLSSYYKQLCRLTISAFFKELNMKEIISLVQNTSGSLEKFLSYMLIKGNDAAITEYTTKDNSLSNEFEILIEKLVKT